MPAQVFKQCSCLTHVSVRVQSSFSGFRFIVYVIDFDEETRIATAAKEVAQCHEFVSVSPMRLCQSTSGGVKHAYLCTCTASSSIFFFSANAAQHHCTFSLIVLLLCRCSKS